MTDLNWEIAPIGTTHFDPMDRNHLKQEEGDSKVWNNCHGWVSSSSGQYPKDLSTMTRLVAKPSWNGNGTPPAGTFCELRVVPHGEWGAATVLFSSSNVIVWDWAEDPAVNGKCTSYTHQVEARPIRTPEQIAAEEHAKAIKELIERTDYILDETAAAAVLAAGYSKHVKE